MANNESYEIDYYENGNIQRKRYYFNNKLHNENGPAEIWYYNNGAINQEFWYNNGKLHNENGPAEIYYYENGNKYCEEYYVNNKIHREDGPAEIYYFNDNDSSISQEEYYLNGKFVMTGKEVEKYINSTKPIKVRTINKLKILYNVCEARNLEDKVEELGRKLLLKTL